MLQQPTGSSSHVDEDVDDQPNENVLNDVSERVVSTNNVDEIGPFKLGDSSLDHVTDVPEDVLILIFSFLEYREIILNISLVNSTFLYTSRNDALWKQFIRNENNSSSTNDEKTHLEIPPSQKSIVRRRVFENTNAHSLYEIFKYEHLTLYKGWYKFRGYREGEENQMENDFFINHKKTFASCEKKPELPDPGVGINYLTFLRSTSDHNKIHLMTCSHSVNFYDIEVNGKAAFDDETQYVSNVEYKYEWKETYEERSLLWCIDTQQHRIPNFLVTGGFSNILNYGSYDPEAEDGEIMKNIGRVPHNHKNGIWNLRIINESSFVTGGADGVAKIFDASTMKEVKTLICDKNGVSTHKSAIYDVDCNPSGRYSDLFLTASADKYIKIFDTRSSNVVGEVFTDAYLYEVNASCFDPSAGKYLFLAGSDRGFIQIIDYRKVSSSSSSKEENPDPSILYDMDVFRLGAIRGLQFDGQKIVVGSKLGVVVMTTDEFAQSLNGSKLAEAPQIDKFIKSGVMVGNDTKNCPWKVVNFIPTSGVMSLEMDDEALIGGDGNGDILIASCPTTRTPFTKMNILGKKPTPSGSKCLVQ
ncbi:hypothetical protein NAEGRDRAFT_53581 [Naegleria gruberi]|uniref:F-box domain-containing protein n=1 Tax=Naegleria gruberi TaxID=5762 RepID=D2VZS6_NAEGR|nr:uncharacterized protein NAEGRDRAFT_53581 [Naegleria gruberi]EFC37750.1 hypothetical protein NAEGRDRAFT_53581 [Naegleria gruberi]|eukprot:XP_002670494.1 hypothetical protein NAEGRDRAFT_53581 [Naegleria gruberi strain NEG-M]